MTPKLHAAAVWMNCQASVRVSGSAPRLDERTDRDEGVLAHEVARAYAQGLACPAGATEEMREGAALWVEAIEQYGPTADWRYEQEIDPGAVISPAIPKSRPDAYLAREGELVVAEYKFGHREVDPRKAWQVIGYLVTLAAELGLPDSTKLTALIVQPRYYGRHPRVRAHSTPGVNRHPLTVQMRTAAADTMKGEAPCKTGEWCRSCDGRRACEVLEAATAGIADEAGVTRIHAQTPAQVGAELRALQHAQTLLKARLDAKEEEALHLLGRGQAVPGYEMGSTQPRERFPAERHGEVIAMGKLLGVDLARPPEPVTPAQARKKGIDASVISAYSVTPPGERKLMPVDYSHSKEVFGNGK